MRLVRLTGPNQVLCVELFGFCLWFEDLPMLDWLASKGYCNASAGRFVTADLGSIDP